VDAGFIKGRLGQACTFAGLLILAGFIWFTHERQVGQCRATSDYEACRLFARANSDEATVRWIENNRLP
jgi:hypothetical protein